MTVTVAHPVPELGENVGLESPVSVHDVLDIMFMVKVKLSG